MFLLMMYLQANKVYKDLEKRLNSHFSNQIWQLLKQNKQPKISSRPPRKKKKKKKINWLNILIGIDLSITFVPGFRC